MTSSSVRSSTNCRLAATRQADAVCLVREVFKSRTFFAIMVGDFVTRLFAEAASTPTAISEPENKRSYRYGSGQPAGTLHAERSNKAHLTVDHLKKWLAPRELGVR
jgi:hypothetical protein